MLEVTDLSVSFQTDEGVLRAVQGVSFTVAEGESVGLVGESGCGKSVTAMSLLRLIPSPPGRIESGRVLFHGEDLARVSSARMRQIRGKAISMVFQEPMTALSPLHRVGAQLAETVRLHRDVSRRRAWEMGEEWLRKVGIPDPAERMFAYPHHLSGGMRQRVMIASALMLGPELVIADEPTTALDVTVQAQIFDLIRDMRTRRTALLLITHDVGVVWEMCDRVAVMYASELVEVGPVREVFQAPLHPYTEALLASVPARQPPGRRLRTIEGQVPSPLDYPGGCRFRERCAYAFDRCASEHPGLDACAPDRAARCFLAAKRRAATDGSGRQTHPAAANARDGREAGAESP